MPESLSKATLLESLYHSAKSAVDYQPLLSFSAFHRSAMTRVVKQNPTAFTKSAALSATLICCFFHIALLSSEIGTAKNRCSGNSSACFIGALVVVEILMLLFLQP